MVFQLNLLEKEISFLRSNISVIIKREINKAENKEVKNSEKMQSDNNKKTYRFEIGDNVYWILWWFGIFTLMFFEKC